MFFRLENAPWGEGYLDQPVWKLTPVGEGPSESVSMVTVGNIHVVQDKNSELVNRNLQPVDFTVGENLVSQSFVA
ncbi:hypothetical protein PPTG_20236, partial [Phytophthora nicotianae INRA-310]